MAIINSEQTTDNTWNTFLQILRAGLHGEKLEPGRTVPVGTNPESRRTDPIGTNWPELFTLASRHHVFPLVADIACQCPDFPSEMLSAVQTQAIQVYMQQTMRTQAFLQIYQKLESCGLHPIILKGLICRALYPDPDQRPSNDEDILIPSEQFEAVHNALLEFGLVCEEEDPDASLHEITYTGPNLRIELHLSFFPEESDAYGECNHLFEGALERAVEAKIDGISGKMIDIADEMRNGSISVWTLAPADHLLYLLCHAYKHFLHTGVGVRQVCDVGIFAEKYAEQIDWRFVRRSCEKVRMAGFAAGVFRIASRHLGFAMPGAFADLEVDETDMLRDMLSGGIYGAIEENRLHSATITLDAVASQKRGRRKAGALGSMLVPMRSIFLPLKSMQEKYSYLKKHPWLLPAAWVQRVALYLQRSSSETSVDAAESLRIGNRRVELLREYGIID